MAQPVRSSSPTGTRFPSGERSRHVWRSVNVGYNDLAVKTTLKL
jgi:hypothetical protein